MTLLRPVLIVLLSTILSSITTVSGPLFVHANAPPTLSKVGRFGRKRRSSDGVASDGLTLGDLESMQQLNNNGGTFIPNDAYFNQQHTVQDEEASTEQSSQQLRRNFRRINLDLSGRVMCHVFSPKVQHYNDNDGNTRAAIQMDSMPLFRPSRFVGDETLRRFQRHLPHVYIGANYDLDEIWYGATRWIAKCSWHLPTVELSNHSNRARELEERIFPTTATRSSWRLDLEREQSVFEQFDSTNRVSLVQNDYRPSMHTEDVSATNQLPPTTQSLSVEYDSAKYSNNRVVDNPTSPSLVQAPTITVNVQTPIFHPRIELRSKKTWIVQHGGDKHGNYYGGTHYTSFSPIERRLETIRDGYRAMVPQSHCNILSDSFPLSTTARGRLKTFGRKVSQWLEDDGWMPKRVTTDLMGNFKSVSEVGFYSKTRSDNCNQKKMMIVPSINNMGIRLRISKGIDWTSLGIFPWSNNNNNNHQQSNRAQTPTRVQFDLCGLHSSGNAISQIGCEFDPLRLGNSFKVVIGHDTVSADSADV